jgi:hypothetical protein
MQLRPMHRLPIQDPTHIYNSWNANHRTKHLYSRSNHYYDRKHPVQNPVQNPVQTHNRSCERPNDSKFSNVKEELRQLAAADRALNAHQQIMQDKQTAIETEVGKLVQQQNDFSNVVTENIDALRVSLANILEIAEQSSKVTLENMEMLYLLTGRANLQDAPPELPPPTPSIHISTEKLKEFANLHKQNEMQMQAAINALVQACS